METAGTKVCFTAMIYLYEGKESIFYAYEDIVLPRMACYGGRIVSRTRIVRKISGEEPDEIHIIGFDSPDGFERYRQDPIRQQHAAMYSQAVRKTVLYESECVYP